ncbi:hypothetical protein ABIB38_000814 [Massilia sp. UYP11]|uniref:hypothetical protein n=1 Tax=Massilia sp. UYP11 TaxID=1756385 RepID=UPI003D1D4C04
MTIPSKRNTPVSACSTSRRAQGTQVLALRVRAIDTDPTREIFLPRRAPSTAAKRGYAAMRLCGYAALDAGAHEVMSAKVTQAVKSGLSSMPGIDTGASRDNVCTNRRPAPAGLAPHAPEPTTASIVKPMSDGGAGARRFRVLTALGIYSGAENRPPPASPWSNSTASSALRTVATNTSSRPIPGNGARRATRCDIQG